VNEYVDFSIQNEVIEERLFHRIIYWKQFEFIKYYINNVEF